MKGAPIPVLVVDDSAIIRGLLTKGLSQDGEIEVVGTAMHGEAALSWLAKKTAEVVILDVEMPVMDGLETLRQIRRLYPDIQVVMASSLTHAGAKTTMMALSLGAVACIAKPQAASSAAAIEIVSRELVPLVKSLSKRGRVKISHSFSKPISEKPISEKPAVIMPRRPTMGLPPQLLVIGSSTGGPNALSRVLTDLGQDFQTPTLIVQHMPKAFTAMMAHHLQNDTGRIVKEAVCGELVTSGVTYVAPGDYHMSVCRERQAFKIQLNQLPEEHFCRPSVNPLFRSAIEVASPRVLAVMLTGMGSDGLEGTHDVVSRGGYVIAQDEASSVVWGMPGSVVNAGLAHEVLPLSEIGPRILRLCRKVAESVS